MAQSYQEFVTTVKLNSEEAKNKLEQLRKETEKWVSERDKLINGGGSKKEINNLSKQISQNEKQMASLQKQAVNVIDTINSTDSSALNDLLQAQKQLNAEMGKTPQNTEYYGQLQEKLALVKTQIAEIRNESKQATVAQQELAGVLQNIDSASLSQLSRAEAALKTKVGNAAYGSADYTQSLADLQQVQQRMAAIKDEQKQVTHAIDEYEAKINAVAKSTKTVNDENKLIERTLKNLDTASIRDIKASIEVINENLEGVERGTKKYAEMTEQLVKLKTELSEIGEEQEESKSWYDTIVDYFNENWGFLTQAWGGLTGLSDTVRQCSEAFAQMEEAMADTRKYTGLSEEGVRELNEALKEMDTRTSREELNELAGAAGRLGITSKEAILEFVDAADKINVALGDDLGDGAIDQVGKLAMAFGEDDRLGLRGAMLATGSAINELAQNSAANAGYLVDFTARVAGVGKQLGMTQSQIMGFGAVMDENLLQDEMSSTAFSQLLTKMASDTAKFAKLAGMDAKEFAALVKTDVNGALMALFENLRKTDGFETLAGMFNEMGLNGTRATGVLTTVCDKLDDVRKHQQTASDGYKEAQSVIGEFNTMNATAEAELDKAKNAFHEVTVELGEQLTPVLHLTVSNGAMVVKTLSTIIGYVTRHKALVVTLTAVLLLNVAAWNRVVIAQKLHAAWLTTTNVLTKAVTASQLLCRSALVAVQATWALLTKGVAAYNVVMRAARIASLTNPFTALLTVVSVLGVAVYGLVKAWQSHRQEMLKLDQEYRNQQAVMRQTNELKKQVAESTAEEKSRVQQLTDIIHSNAYSVDERRAAIKRLQQIVPDYHAKISEAGKLYDENVQSIRAYIDALDAAAMAEAIYAKKVEISKQKLELQSAGSRIQGSIKATKAYQQNHADQMTTTREVSDGQGNSATIKVLTEEGRKQQQALHTHEQRLAENTRQQNELAAQEEALNATLKSNTQVQKLYAQKVTSTTGGTNGGSNGGSTGGTTGGVGGTGSGTGGRGDRGGAGGGGSKTDPFKEEVDAQKKRNEALQAENALAYYKGEIALSEYEKKKQELAEQGNAALQEIYRKYGQSTLTLEVEAAKDKFDQQQKADEEHRTASLDALNREHAQRKLALQMAAQDETSTLYGNQSALDEALFQEDQDYLRRKAALYAEGSKERMETEAQLAEDEEQHKLDLAIQYNERLQQYREQWLSMGNAEQESVALQGLDELYAQGLVKEEDYQKMRRRIQAQYAKSPTEQKNEDFDADVQDTISLARSRSGGGYDKTKGMSLTNNPYVGMVTQYKSTMSQIKQMEKQGEIDHRTAEQAKAEVTSQFLTDMVSKTQAAYDSVNQIMSAMSGYYTAQSEYEQAVVTKKYDKQIEAAGNNTAKTKKLEEKKQKELAKIKSKYNKKQMKIEIAQAVASTAMAAINSYASASKESWVLGAVAAAMATAAGMIQIATIKKQHAAEEAGYYEGGFTGGSSYRRAAGIVHEGEFVVNHDGVNNPQLSPLLRMLDYAQQRNTVGSLTSADVSRQLGQGGAAVVAPVVNVATDNSGIEGTLATVDESVRKLSAQIDKGITANVSIDGQNGVAHQMELYNRLRGNV